MKKFLENLIPYTKVLPFNFNWIKSSRFWRRIVGSNAINVVDIGSRDLTLGELNTLSKHVNYICFDADSKESERLATSPISKKYLNFTSLPFFIGKDENSLNFYSYNLPGDSSSLLPSEYYESHYNSSFRVNSKIHVVSKSLDSALEFINCDIDFLKLDTQGSELLILENAQKSLKNCLMIECECEFIEMYSGQPLFHDISKFLYEKKFELLYLNRVFVSREKPRFKRCRGQLIFGDALFGLRFEAARHLELRKKFSYIILLINYGHIDFAYRLFFDDKKLIKKHPNLSKYLSSCEAKSTNNIFSLSKFTLSVFLDWILYVLLWLRKSNQLRQDSDRSYNIN